MAATSHQAQVPALVAEYFGTPYGDRSRHPVIAQEFRPGRGWVHSPMRKRVSISWLRKLRRQGVTDVALAADGRIADFRIAEIIRYAERPLFGGRII